MCHPVNNDSTATHTHTLTPHTALTHGTHPPHSPPSPHTRTQYSPPHTVLTLSPTLTTPHPYTLYTHTHTHTVVLTPRRWIASCSSRTTSSPSTPAHLKPLVQRTRRPTFSPSCAHGKLKSYTRSLFLCTTGAVNKKC